MADLQTKLTLHGAWQGQVGDPTRQFRGRVTASEHPALSEGQSVTVQYSATGHRLAGAAEHGQYVLEAGGETYPLSTFTRPLASRPGRDGMDDTAEGDWQATLLTAE